MTFLNEQHRLSFNAALDRIGQYDRKNFALVAGAVFADSRFPTMESGTVICRELRYQLRQAATKELRRVFPDLFYCVAKDLYLGN